MGRDFAEGVDVDAGADGTSNVYFTLASIGPITSQALRDLGHEPTIEAPEPTIPALIQSLQNHISESL